MTYSEAEARIAELRQRLENIKSTLGAGDIGISVDPQAVASAQIAPQGLVAPAQGTEMFPAASTGIGSLAPIPPLQEQIETYFQPPGNFLGNLAVDVPRTALEQVAFAEDIARDPLAAGKGMAQGLGEAIRMLGAFQGIPEPAFQKERREQLGGREITRESILEQMYDRPVGTTLQMLMPVLLSIGGAKLAGKAKIVKGLMDKGKPFKEATTIGMKAAGIKSPEAAIAKWDAEITRQFEQQLKPKPKEASDALQGKEAQAPKAKAEEVGTQPVRNLSIQDEFRLKEGGKPYSVLRIDSKTDRIHAVDITGKESSFVGETPVWSRVAKPKAQEVAPVPKVEKGAVEVAKPVVVEKPKPIGLKKTEIEQIRRNTGIDQLEPAERRGWEEVLHKAKNEKVDQTILASTDEIIKTGRQISDVEHAGMVVKAAKLANEYDASIKTVNNLIEKGDPAAVKLENARAESIIAQMDKLTEASDVGGREVARSLSIRRMMVNRETYDLAHIVQRAQAAKGGKLTTAERGKFEQITAEHGRLQEKLKTVEANYDKLIAERELMGAEKVAAIERKKAKIEKRKVVLREKIQAERADIKKQLTAMGYRVNDITGITAEGSYLVGKLAVNYIKDGAVSLDAVVKKVLTDLPQLTKRDVYQSLITKDPKVQAKVRIETMKRVGQLKTQARLLLDIEKVEKGIFEPITATQRATQPVAIRQLQKKLRDLRATAYKSNMSAARLEKAVKTINELQDQLANHYRSVKKGKPELIPDLASARQKIKDLRKTMHVADELTKTQDQLRTGNYDIKVKPVEKPILPELERAQIQLKVNRKQIRQAIKEMEPMTAGKVGIEAINTARTLKATADMSAVLRQGLVLSVRRPIKAGKAFGKSFKAFFDKYTAEQIDNAIKSSPNHYLREKAGLQLMEVGGRVSRGEEMFMSSVAEKIPLYGRVVKASERHMVSYLNMMRTAAFDQFLQKFPNATHAELKVWANFVNVASGRGNLGKFAGAANILSLGFFAPRFAISRIQTPLALFKRGISRRVRKEIAKDLVATASLGATVLTLAHLAGAEVGTDPRSADWGKIKVGNTRIDIWGGMQQPMRVVARTGLGITDKWGLTGEDLTDWQKDVDPVELAARFSQYKLSPLATIPLELYKGETIVGEDVTPSETAIKAMIPMVYEDMADAWRLEGAAQAAWVGGLAFFGAGVSTYNRKEKRENTIRKLLEEARKAKSTDARKRKESAAKALQTKWNNEHEKDKISIFR